MIMLLEQDQMMRSCRLHLTVAFGLLEPLLRLSILFRPHKWWRRRVPPPGPKRLCRSSQRPKQFYLYKRSATNSIRHSGPTTLFVVCSSVPGYMYQCLSEGPITNSLNRVPSLSSFTLA